MEAGASDQISRLLQRMREERAQGKPPTATQHPQAAGSRKFDSDQADDEDEEDVLPSRYMDPRDEESSGDLGVSEESEEDSRPARTASLHAFERASPSSDSDESVEDPRTKLNKRMEELRARREMLGPPARVQAESAKERTEEQQEKKETVHLKPQVDDREAEIEPKVARPRTAQTKPQIARSAKPSVPAFICTPARKKKRTDPVSLYQQRQKEWQSSKFLKANKENAKEGRKLKLAEYATRPSFHVVHEKPPVPKTQYVAPHEKRRDDLRFQTRVKMAAPVDLHRPQTAKS